MSEGFQFAFAVLGFWLASLVTSGVMTGAVLLAERLTKYRLSKRGFVALFVVIYLVVAFFLAWKEQYKLAANLAKERERLATANSALEATVKEKENRIDDLRSKNETLLQHRPIEIQFPPAALPAAHQPSAAVPPDEDKPLLVFIQRGHVIEIKFHEVMTRVNEWESGNMATREEDERWSRQVSAFLKKNYDKSYAELFVGADEFHFRNNPPLPSDFYERIQFRIAKLRTFVRRQ